SRSLSPPAFFFEIIHVFSVARAMEARSRPASPTGAAPGSAHGRSTGRLEPLHQPPPARVRGALLRTCGAFRAQRLRCPPCGVPGRLDFMGGAASRSQRGILLWALLATPACGLVVGFEPRELCDDCAA